MRLLAEMTFLMTVGNHDPLLLKSEYHTGLNGTERPSDYNSASSSSLAVLNT